MNLAVSEVHMVLNKYTGPKIQGHMHGSSKKPQNPQKLG